MDINRNSPSLAEIQNSEPKLKGFYNSKIIQNLKKED